MASGPRGFGTRRGRRGWAGAEVQSASVCARRRAPPGEGPGGAAAGGGPAAPLLPFSGLRGPLRVRPAARVLARAGYLPAIARGGGGGRGRAPESGPAVPGAAPFQQLALGFWLAVGGAVAPARPPKAIESGLTALSGSACPAARQLSGRLGPRPRGRPLRRRAWRPPAGGSAWSGAPWSAGLAGRSRGGWSPPGRHAPATVAPTPAPSRRQDSLTPVVMVTAAPVNGRLSDTPAPVQPEVVRVPGGQELSVARGPPAPGGVKMSGRDGAPGVGLRPLTDSGTWS